jgi:hypothetical protein
MSNAKTNKEQNVKIDQTPSQLSPRDALPTDFKIGKPSQTSNAIGHNQRGRSPAEEKKLFAEANGVKAPFPVPNKSTAGKQPPAKVGKK